MNWKRQIGPIAFVAILLVAWQIGVSRKADHLLPTPVQVLSGFGKLISRGLLVKYIVASLFRVIWGYALAVVLAIPLGLGAGWNQRCSLAVNPIIQVLRPISPLAWIPISILWFGVGDLSAMFLIFVATFFPLFFTAMNAVRRVAPIHLNAGRNFGLGTADLISKVVFPAVVPQILIGMRIALGIAWLVVVAAEMIAVNSGLGFLIIDSRNAGNRYDLVVAGMVAIGLIGLLLDTGMRSFEKIPSVRWGYSED